MEVDPLLCFQHCESDTNIFCFRLPEVCPICSARLNDCYLRMPLFRPPGPFSDSRDFPFCVVLKPTSGNFLNDFTSSSNLHIGVTDSEGSVFDFDEKGINRSRDGWKQCLSMPILKNLSCQQHLEGIWNVKLWEFTAHDDWRPERYLKNEHNCYDFVISFLQFLELDQFLPCISNKTDFCSAMVLPQTKRASKYISVYREVLQHSTFVSQKTSF